MPEVVTMQICNDFTVSRLSVLRTYYKSSMGRVHNHRTYMYALGTQKVNVFYHVFHLRIRLNTFTKHQIKFINTKIYIYYQTFLKFGIKPYLPIFFSILSFKCFILDIRILRKHLLYLRILSVSSPAFLFIFLTSCIFKNVYLKTQNHYF